MAPITISRMGTRGLLLEASGGFSENVQDRIHAVATRLRLRGDVVEVVPGMNNLLVCFDPGKPGPDAADQLLRALWKNTKPQPTQGNLIEIPVVYGGEAAKDLQDWAAHCGLP